MADVPFVPERYVLQRRDRIPAQHPGETAQALARDRVSLVRHGRAAFLAFAKKFFHFEDFGALKMAEPGPPPIDARCDQRQGDAKLRVAVPLDDLRGDVRRFQSEAFTD